MRKSVVPRRGEGHQDGEACTGPHTEKDGTSRGPRAEGLLGRARGSPRGLQRKADNEGCFAHDAPSRQEHGPLVVGEPVRHKLDTVLRRPPNAMGEESGQDDHHKDVQRKNAYASRCPNQVSHIRGDALASRRDWKTLHGLTLRLLVCAFTLGTGVNVLSQPSLPPPVVLHHPPSEYHAHVQATTQNGLRLASSSFNAAGSTYAEKPVPKGG
mmetsp:Transcript_27967/g.65178  ORF Transcript_27967/g.65178 Transcript_27967/m.65178 type:complete len:212 (+) Transcript_27967:548-1183(+)